jgi:hypothetical protein
MSLIAATQVTAVATAVLAVFAIVTAVFAFLAFRKQSTEVTTLQRQFDDQRKVNDLQARELQESLAERRREAEERRRAQAARVYVIINVFPRNKAHPGNEYVAGRSARQPAIGVIVHNASDRPVYDVRIHYLTLPDCVQAGTEDSLGTLGPQDRTAPVQRDVPNGPVEQFIAIAYFRDAAGLRWTVTPNGLLASVDAELRAGAPLIATRAAERAYPPSSQPRAALSVSQRSPAPGAGTPMPGLTPSALAIWVGLSPRLRRALAAASLSGSMIVGRPPVRPWARAAARAAMVRS